MLSMAEQWDLDTDPEMGCSKQPMAPRTISQHLAQAELDFADACARVSAREDRIAELQSSGQSTAEARRQLLHCVRLAQIFEHHRDRLQAISELLNLAGDEWTGRNPR